MVWRALLFEQKVACTLMTAQCGTLCMTWSVDLYAPSCLACIMTAAHVPVCVLPMLLGHCNIIPTTMPPVNIEALFI